MRVILRYFHNPKTDRVVTSIGGLAYATKNKCEVRNVIHADGPDGWLEALRQSSLILKSQLLASFWKCCATIVWALWVLVILWWLPFGLQIRWGWPAFLVLAALPLVVVLLGFQNAFGTLIFLRRLPRLVMKGIKAGFIVESHVACPTMLLAERTEKPIRRWSVIVNLIVLLVFVGTIGRTAFPLPSWAIIVYDLGGSHFSSEEAHRLAASQYWEYAPRFVRGTAYGMLFYKEDMAEVLVLDATYIMENSNHRSPVVVRERIQIWVSNITNYFAMNIRGSEDVDLAREELMQKIKEEIESEPVQMALNRVIKDMVSNEFEERFTTLRFDVKWVSIDEYVSKIR